MKKDITPTQEEIKITREMIEAGAAEILKMDWRVAGAESLAEWVYSAMERAKNRKTTHSGGALA